MAKDIDTVDVLVIGAGASGAAFSWSLAGAGFDVTCLDQGGWLDPTQYPTTHDDWEVHWQTDLNPDPNVRRLPQDYPINNDASPIKPLMYNAVGGSTIHWNAHFPRLHPSDFRVRSLDGVADDWPVSYEELEPFFDLNDRMVGVAGLNGDTAYPPKPPRQTRPIPLGRLGQTIAAGFDKMGWHWWPSDTAILTEPYDERLPCNNCGPCDLGCTRRSRASADVTYWPKAVAKGVRLRTHCRVREVTVGSDGLADGAIYYDSEDAVQRQKARVVVVACNGVGTPRLLLSSTSNMFPDGLANRSGLVGRNLMFHTESVVTGFFEEPTDGHTGPSGCSVFSHEFYETDLSRGFARGYSLQVVRSLGPVSTALGEWTRHRVPWGQGHHGVMSDRLRHSITVIVFGEDLPEAHNRVSLDPGLTDGDGIPAPKVEYAIGENSLRMMAHGVDRASELMKAAGAGDVAVNPQLEPAGGHLMGTARMGADGSTSVVDGWGRAHDVRNLFVIDGSIWVTGGAVNPTSTIQALALRTAGYVKREARHLLH